MANQSKLNWLHVISNYMVSYHTHPIILITNLKIFFFLIKKHFEIKTSYFCAPDTSDFWFDFFLKTIFIFKKLDGVSYSRKGKKNFRILISWSNWEISSVRGKNLDDYKMMDFDKANIIWWMNEFCLKS